jgi:hypothetical protein
LNDEEIDIEALTTSIHSLLGLYEQREKIASRITELDKDRRDIASGKTNIKSLFSFKSKKDDLCNIETTKATLEKNLADLDQILKLATYNMESYVEYFKVEKLAGYYNSLNKLAEIQKVNSESICSLWTSVSKDKNIQNLSKDN